MKYIFNAFAFTFIILLTSCNSNNKEYKKIIRVTNDIHFTDGYAGDQNCVSCHEKEYYLWKGSHHDLAMQVARDSTVLGDFNDKFIVLDRVSYHFFKKDHRFFVGIKEIDGTEKTYQIKYTFGFTPLQQYLVDFDKGRKQTLRVTWDTLKKRWFHQYKGDVIKPNDWLHWTKGAQNWNTMCAECHSTNLKKNYYVEKDSFHTTWSSINVSCEACHGPGEKHLQWAYGDQKSKDHHILNSTSKIQQINECAPCHSRRSKLTNNMTPGMKYEDQYMIQTLTSNLYFPDGQIMDEDYVVGSFLQSKMYHSSVKCTNCHDPHSMQLKFQGNTLCLQCHIKSDYDTPKHHFHKENTEESLCINCHMTGRYYMGNDFRRDHSFRIPRPDQSVEYHTPNACTGCHKDKTNKWAADKIVKWYGPNRRDHFSDILLLSTKYDLTNQEKEKINAFINNVKYPYISRATAIENMQITSNDDLLAILKTLNDSAALVRYKALQKFNILSPEERTSIALKHIRDSVKLVRVGAAQLLLDLDINSLQEPEKSDLLKAREDYLEMLHAGADFSTGRFQMGDYFMRTGNLKEALKNYKKAIEMDSLLFPVYGNLATTYSMISDNQNALKTLNTLIKLDPENARAFYLRALVNFEMENEEQAVADFKKATEINPNDSRSYYNLATYYYQNKIPLKALNNIRKALQIEPQNRDYKYLLALIYQGIGEIQKANVIFNELKADQFQQQ